MGVASLAVGALMPCPACGGELATRRLGGKATIDCEQFHRAVCDADLYESARLQDYIVDLHEFLGADVARVCPDGQHTWMRVPGMSELVSCPRCSTFAVPPLRR